MKNKLTNNLSLKILAVVVAILVWMIVVNVSDPIIESTYSGVQVEILNGDLINQNNQTYEVLNDSNTISVTVMAKRSINDLLGKENIRATADMAELDEENGTVRIRLETNKYNDKLESIKSKNDVLEVSIEDLMKKQLRITPVINGEPVEGYVTGDVVLDQNVVTVQGPESVVSQIDYATVEASIAGMSGSISTTSAIRYYDKEGKQLDASRLNGNISAVSIKVDVLATKALPIKINTSGTLAENYSIDGEILPDKEEVTVAGKTSVLANMSAVTIPATAIDVTDKNATFTVTLDLNKYLPENVQIAEKDFDGKITVEIPIAQLETKTYEISKDNIQIRGINEEKQRIVIAGNDDVIEVKLKGLPGDLETVKTADLKGEILVADYLKEKNLDELKEGTYDLPVILTLPEGVTVDEDFTIECRIRDID
ncbi:MAG: hypothetical protein IJZ44_07290 [Lachnospiraceae bacterium]|nr:hypothetical protein [Lachnospiraceae bacterium]